MLLKTGKFWASSMWAGRALFTTFAPANYKTINGVALGTSNAVVGESQIGIQGTVIWDTLEVYTIPKWNSVTITPNDGPSRVPAFGFAYLVVDVAFDTYQLNDRPVVREVVLFANYEKKPDGFPGWPPPPAYIPFGKYPYFPIARFIINPITIDPGDSLTVTWTLEFKDDQSDA